MGVLNLKQKWKQTGDIYLHSMLWHTLIHTTFYTAGCQSLMSWLLHGQENPQHFSSLTFICFDLWSSHNSEWTMYPQTVRHIYHTVWVQETNQRYPVPLNFLEQKNWWNTCCLGRFGRICLRRPWCTEKYRKNGVSKRLSPFCKIPVAARWNVYKPASKKPTPIWDLASDGRKY